ncbi:MAG TPA: hypothetical protein VLT79_01825 [Gemmatimonadales bacterium]|nr:hypothetical protein [Gemmatimonadales bacterium]
MFDRLRNALRAALDAATPAQDRDLRDLVRQMREALIEAKASVEEMRTALTHVEAELVAERRQLADAERRGRLAAEIQDGETVTVAERFAARHRERIGMLQQKLEAQRAEVALVEREIQDMRDQVVQAERDRPRTEAERSAQRAWRDLQRGGEGRPGADQELDSAARERRAEEQLRELKKRMKKD